LVGFEDFKLQNMRVLSTEFETGMFYSMEGTLGYTGIKICPFKSENGKIYQLTSFEYTLTEGSAFTYVQK